MEIQLAFNNPRPTKRGKSMRKSVRRKSNPEITLMRRGKDGKNKVEKRKLLIPDRKDMKNLSQESKPLVQALKKDKQALAKKAAGLKKQMRGLDKDLKTFRASKKMFKKDQSKQLKAMQKEGWLMSSKDKKTVSELFKGVKKVAKKKKSASKKAAKKVKKVAAPKKAKKARKSKKARKAKKAIKKSSPKKLKAAAPKKAKKARKGRKAKKVAALAAAAPAKKIRKNKARKASKKARKARKARRKSKKVVAAPVAAPKKKKKKSKKKVSKKSSKKKASRKSRKARKASAPKTATGYKKKKARKAKKSLKKTIVVAKGQKIKAGKSIFKRLNPFGGNMIKKVEKVIAHDVMEAGGLLVGGAAIKGINHGLAVFAPTLKAKVQALPVLGPIVAKNLDAIIPLALGIAANHFVKNAKVQAVAKGVIGASVVNIGASLYNAAATMAGANPTQLQGIVAIPSMGAISYQQNDYGLGRIVDSGMAGESKALGVEHTDFGGMGYVEKSDFNSTMMSGYGEEESMN